MQLRFLIFAPLTITGVFLGPYFVIYTIVIVSLISIYFCIGRSIGFTKGKFLIFIFTTMTINMLFVGIIVAMPDWQRVLITTVSPGTFLWVPDSAPSDCCWVANAISIIADAGDVNHLFLNYQQARASLSVTYIYVFQIYITAYTCIVFYSQAPSPMINRIRAQGSALKQIITFIFTIFVSMTFISVFLLDTVFDNKSTIRRGIVSRDLQSMLRVGVLTGATAGLIISLSTVIHFLLEKQYVRTEYYRRRDQ